MVKVVTIVGARPQFIKAAALSRAIKKAQNQGASIREILVHTGQHYDVNMSDVFFEEMEIPSPQYYLGVGGCSHGAMTGRMMEELEKILAQEQPDWTLIFGDTNSTLAGALTAVKMHIRVAHVEAGLRSFNRSMPEEINRIVADHCADLLLTPTKASSDQLLREGIPHSKIKQVGDVMHDAALYYSQKAHSKSSILKTLTLPTKGYALATIHRAENTDNLENLHEIFQGLIQLAEEGLPIVIPLHPRTKAALDKINITPMMLSKLIIIDPIGYFDMIQLERHAKIILTDSGGVQKEAYFFQVPCLTLRNETEWVELVQNGFNDLCPPNKNSIVASCYSMASRHFDWQTDLYGKGNASDEIVKELLNI